MNEIKYYTGIGSRATPEPLRETMQALAGRLAGTYRLRSGGALGADTAFELGARKAEATLGVDVYRPRYDIHPICYEIAEFIHPHWKAMKPFTRQLFARNVEQILGSKVNHPSQFVVCWTPDACETMRDYRPKQTGGTGLAIALAQNLPVLAEKFELKHVDGSPITKAIPVFNLRKSHRLDQLCAWLGITGNLYDV